jgi:hypothetical protein
MLIAEADKAYAAGYFEGRGYFRITMNGGRSDGPRIRCVVNIHHSQAVWFVERWGGTLQKHTAGNTGSTASTLTRYAAYWCSWTLSLDDAKKFLVDILPYLQRKDRVAKVSAAYLNALSRMPVKLDGRQLARLRRLAELADELREKARY